MLNQESSLNKATSIEDRVLLLEQHVQNLQSESQYINLTIKAIGIDVQYLNCEISCGKQVKMFASNTIDSGQSDSAEWRGKSWAPVGAEVKVYFKIDENNKFQYYGLSPFSGENQSDLILEGITNKDMYEVTFECRGNLLRDGALGQVIVKVKKLQR